MRGIFENGNPFVEIEIKGFAGDFKKINALIDSGFNGYLTLPYVEAFPLGLVLLGTQSSVLANGTRADYFVCMGRVKLENKEISVSIDIHSDCNILLGTKLLAELGKTLILDPANKTVELR